MTHTPLKAVRAGLLTALVLLVCAAPARADAGHPAPDSLLLLTVSHGQPPSTAGSGSLLRCDPPHGHRHAERACAELAAADGDIAAIPAKDVFCPMVHAPVTAHARGTWRGRPVEYTETFPNTCVMAARTGSVFALDGV
ncbi:SSI family serine proteinase inhibitor [Streptomyces capillispiralis]|uniref:Subtilisin inhibitor-like n=1 Tax=Streptomyces capillispiralis TaxID=68182 RepID=A0A561TB77_9ACTN|nr:SSI family serine proteinase inhibitor [Streptomyces capillispiralis]TWF84371.1 subtilisin inhibitor-like [Streptomyces capillispiralis]GHH91915.1 protease [Streptomyces capillispiralis]